MSVDTEAASQETRDSIVAFIRSEAAKQEALAAKFFDKFSDMKFGGPTADGFKAHGAGHRIQAQFLEVLATKVSMKVDRLKVCVSPEDT